MARRLSLNARLALDAAASDVVEVVLIRITHPELDAPVLLSTDPTTRLSIDPLSYGTRSSWRNPAGAPWLFVLASAIVPDDLEDDIQSARIVLEALDRRMAAAVRSTTRPATVDMAVVLSSSPDQIEAEWLGLRLVDADGDSGQIVLDATRDPITQEPWPAGRMTRDVAPGLHQ